MQVVPCDKDDISVNICLDYVQRRDEHGCNGLESCTLDSHEPETRRLGEISCFDG